MFDGCDGSRFSKLCQFGHLRLESNWLVGRQFSLAAIQQPNLPLMIERVSVQLFRVRAVPFHEFHLGRDTQRIFVAGFLRDS